MAYRVTRLALRTRARREANMVNSTFVTDAEIHDWINAHIAELYDLLTAKGDPDYYSTSSTITVIGGTTAYPLPEDFRSLTAVYSVEGTRRSEVPPVSPGRMGEYGPPRSGSVSIEYVPAPPLLTSDDDPVTGTIDTVSGWDSLIVALVARDMLAKEESDVSVAMQKIGELRARIQTHAPSRYRGPRYITDVDGYGDDPFGGVAGFRIRAGNIELYGRSGGAL